MYGTGHGTGRPTARCSKGCWVDFAGSEPVVARRHRGADGAPRSAPEATALAGGPHPCAHRHQDRGRGRLRRRQDDLRRRGLGDHAAADRGADDAGERGRPTTSPRRRRRSPPPSPWTSAGSRSTTTWCCTSSARPASSASGSCGTTWCAARSARSCWPTPAGCRTASRRWTTSRAADCRTSSPSTTSRAPHAYDAEDVREALSVPPHVPVVIMDARKRDHGRRVAAGAGRPRPRRHARLRQARDCTYARRRETRHAEDTHRRSRPVRAPARPRPPVAGLRGHPDVQPHGGRDPGRPGDVHAVHVRHGAPARARPRAQLLGAPGPAHRGPRRLRRRPPTPGSRAPSTGSASWTATPSPSTSA